MPVLRKDSRGGKNIYEINHFIFFKETLKKLHGTNTRAGRRAGERAIAAGRRWRAVSAPPASPAAGVPLGGAAPALSRAGRGRGRQQ